MNLINAKYGNEPGLKAYTHVSNQFGPFATQTIPATVSEAPYILDGLLMNEAGRNIREQYADTGGFTDHVFAVTALLGFQFIPRIRDLPSKRLYVFDPAAVPKELKGLIGGKVRQHIITINWPDILRSAATMVAGVMPPSQLLRKFAAYPRQHELAENRTGGTNAVHHQLASRRRHAAPRPDRSEQRRGTSRIEKRPAHRTPR
jgi:TnpA family transposase